VLLPEGYTHQVVTAWGDPVSGGPRWDPNAANSADEQAVQMGMHADGLRFFPLPQGSNESSRGVLCVNNEYTDEGLLHQGGLQPVTAEKVRKSQAAHGVTIVEIALERQPLGRGASLEPRPAPDRVHAHALRGPGRRPPAAADEHGSPRVSTRAARSTTARWARRRGART
jgi:secreted PhoX family phosphatase